MMENYDQARNNSSRLEQLDDVHPIKLLERNEFFSSVEELTANNQNFNFGANLLNTKTMSTSSLSMAPTTINSCGEDAVKTNNEIKTFALPPAVDIHSEASSIGEALAGVADTDPLSMNSNQEELDSSKFIQHEPKCNESSQDSQNFRNSLRDNDDECEETQADESDDSTSDSDYSDLSGISDMSGKDWKPISQRPFNWVQKQIHSGANPREILSKFLPSSAQRLPLTDMQLWRILLASIVSEPPRRKKLSYVNTFQDVINLLHKSKNIIVLTGAGVSVSCGIPDFRSSDGIYSRLAKDFPDLPGPQAMFDINYFLRDPRPFYKFAREIYPGQFKPSPCHRFIKMLEQKQKLLRNYTQNIDTLEREAGINNVIECHGSFSTASCTKCKYKCDADSIREDIFAQRIPVCPRCQPNVEQSLDASISVSENELRQLVENGIMKPDIVFFGEGLPDEFHTVMASDKDKCDLLIVMGSSLKVRPVALIPSSIPSQVPQILINRELLHHLEFDVELLGDGDVIINQICHRLGDDWKDICFNDEVLKESKVLLPLEEEIDDEDTAKEIPTDSLTETVKSSQASDQTVSAGTTFQAVSGFVSSVTCSKKDVEFLTPDDMDEPLESASLGGSCDYRHFSIDSSKDSGILGDSSNSALATSLSNFPDSTDINKGINTPATTTQTISNKSVVNSLSNTKTADNNYSNVNKQHVHRQLNQKKVAERLHKGTYYVHDNSTSHIFPGAQVSFCSDTEEDEEENLDEYEENHCNDDDTIHAPLSPLMTPSVENEMVKAIASTSNANQHPAPVQITFMNAVAANSSSQQKTQADFSPQKKRHSNDTPAEESDNFKIKYISSEAKCNINTASSNSHPPIKKRRDSSEFTKTLNNFSPESS